MTKVLDTHSPRPDPLRPFVVKNGSKRFSLMFSGIPEPRSWIVMRAPGHPPRWIRAARTETSVSGGAASAAFRIRLLSTWDSWPGKPQMIIADSWLYTRRTRRKAADLPDIVTTSPTSLPTSIGIGICESRWKASDCFVIRRSVHFEPFATIGCKFTDEI